MTDTELNGWNTEQMTEAVEGIRQKPDSGKLTWRSRVSWDSGFGVDVRTREIKQLGESIERQFTIRGDHPPELLGHDTGPTAVETLLAALGACVAGTFAAQATVRGIHIDALEVDVEAAIDLNGFFGLSSVRPGLSDVRLALRVESNADLRVLEDVLSAAESHSPVFDSITRRVDAAATVNKI